ncbi:MAG: macro domain-containing protein [Candidatus Saccharibacteria bacterium]
MIEIINGVQLEIVRGDIGKQVDIDAVVNAANAYLMPGGGVAGVIHRGAGPGLAEECRPLAPIKPGEAVITAGHKLPNRYVIHCLGPVYGKDHPEAELLANCYINALKLADEKGIQSIAFPAISTGIFGYPLMEAADVALRAIQEIIPSLQEVKLIRMVPWDREALAAHETALKKLLYSS